MRNKKTHCAHGHEYTESNSYINPNTGYRYCRECRRLYHREWRRQKVRKHKSRMKQAYLHDHSPFAEECNSGCGWYDVKKIIAEDNL